MRRRITEKEIAETYPDWMDKLNVSRVEAYIAGFYGGMQYQMADEIAHYKAKADAIALEDRMEIIRLTGETPALPRKEARS